MSVYISNSFSLDMINIVDFDLIRVKKVAPSEIPQNVISVIDHFDMARIVSDILGFEVPNNKANITLTEDDILYVVQYKGPILPKGVLQLPNWATINFLEITMQHSGCGTCSAFDCEQCDVMSWMHGI